MGLVPPMRSLLLSGLGITAYMSCLQINLSYPQGDTSCVDTNLTTDKAALSVHRSMLHEIIGDAVLTKVGFSASSPEC